MKQQVALLGADRAGRQALANALAPRLQGTSFFVQAVEDSSQLQSPALVLLLASSHAHGDEEGLRWREWLVQSGIAFSVLHGEAQARLDGAWRLIAPLLGLAAPSQAGSEHLSQDQVQRDLAPAATEPSGCRAAGPWAR